MTISIANLEDVPQIVAVCYKNFHENGENLPKPDTMKAVKSVSSFVNDGLVFVKKDENGTIVAVLILIPFEFWWSDEVVLNTATMYVVPEYRDKDVFDELLAEAKEYADVNGSKLYSDIMVEKDLDKKDVLMRRKGFVKTGYLYRYSPKD